MEANRKRVQVHMLPTEQSHIVKDIGHGNLKLTYFSNIKSTKGWYECQHLYITTDEEIKEGDWFINTNFQKIYQANSENSKNIIEFGPHPEIRKIIATTDPKLCIECTYKGDDKCKSLPQPSQASIKAYCEQGGFDEVLVEYELNVITSLELIRGDKMRAEESDFQPKTDPNNCTIIHPVGERRKECMHDFHSVYYGSEWEFKSIPEYVECKKCEENIFDLYEREDAVKWIKENL